MPDCNPISKDAGPDSASRWRRARLVTLLAVAWAALPACGEIVPVDRPDATPTDMVDATPMDGSVSPDAVAADNADLADLGLSVAGELSPAFDPEVTEYTASLSILVQQLRVIPTAVHPDATITVDDVEVQQGEASGLISLLFGVETVITVEVTAPAGNSRTYTLTVDRDALIQQTAYGKASNPGENDRFGLAMAISGDTLVVGAQLEDSNGVGVNGDQDNDDAPDSGAVYVFRRQGSTWAQEAYIKASNTDPNDQFGTSVAIAGDVLVVGAPGEDGADAGIGGNENSDGLDAAGAVYVFRRTGSTWAQEAYVKASNPGAADLFGFYVAVDGDTLAVGAPREDGNGEDGQGDNSVADSGAVYVFRHNGSEWAQEAYLKASNPDPNDQFGFRLDLDGSTLAIASINEASASDAPADNSAPGAGAVYVFRRDGAEWEQEDYLKAEEPGGPTTVGEQTEPTGDQFGIRVAVDGDTIVVGAHFEDSNAREIDGDATSNAALNAGAAYVFRRGNGGNWSQEAYLKPSNVDAGDLFGQNFALVGDLLVVASNGEDSNATGVGGNKDSNDAESAGAVFLFRRNGTTWREEAYIKASNTQQGDNFGFNVAMTSDTLAVGAALEDSGIGGIDIGQNDESQPNSGAFYIFN